MAAGHSADPARRLEMFDGLMGPIAGRENATGTFLAAERDLLTEVFPNGTVEERHVVSLAVATR
ncbi:hypothetical protein [Streptomyces sp. NPDC048496]|uniref:hypothetical protein n=1 Tax=Streptomyces sp. NPDC048496 TaxID=3365558 RepID=UPI00371C6972